MGSPLRDCDCSVSDCAVSVCKDSVSLNHFTVYVKLDCDIASAMVPFQYTCAVCQNVLAARVYTL